MSGTPYTVYGYGGKQVRDAIHTHDLVSAFLEFFKAPRVAEVYNIGGGRASHSSVLEAIELSQDIASRPLEWTYDDRNRLGDHIWWVSSNERFEAHYPEWHLTRNISKILKEIFDKNGDRWGKGTARRSTHGVEA